MKLRAGFGIVIALGSTFAHTQTWRFGGDLMPNGFRQGQIHAISRSQVAGWLWDGNRTQAILWAQRIPGNYKSLTYPNMSGQRIYGLGPGMQVGSFVDRGFSRAALWRGTQASLVSLHPTVGVWQTSEARATNGIYQVGWVKASQPDLIRGAVWSGNAGTIRALNLPQSDWTAGFDFKGVTIAGYGRLNRRLRAASWNINTLQGTYWHPNQATESNALTTDGTRLGGWVRTATNTNTQAALFPYVGGLINLHPASARSSGVYAMMGAFQGGGINDAQFNTKAVVWKGTAASMVDLHRLIPWNSKSVSVVLCLFHDGQGTYYAGGYWSTATGLTRPVWWWAR